MNDTQIIDALIVGAGPAGLTLALDLVRRGITCRIIDQEPTYHIGSRARHMQPSTLAIFEELGVLESLVARSEPFLPLRVYDQDNRLVREDDLASRFARPSTPDALSHVPLKISQQQAEAALREYLASHGVHVELNCQLINFSQDASHVLAYVQCAGRRGEIRARYLVGCDGGHSTVRTCANISFPACSERAVEEGPLGFVGNTSVDGLDPAFSLWTNRNSPGGISMMLEPIIRDNTWFFYVSIPPDERTTFTPTLEALQRLFDNYVRVPNVRFSHPLWLSTFRPQNLRLAEQYRNGRVFLAGDAAHVGMLHGMEAGIQDAHNLGWKLVHVLQGAPDDLLDTYLDERRPIAQQELAAGGLPGMQISVNASPSSIQ